jgi:cytochrome c oxidase subunit IV
MEFNDNYPQYELMANHSEEEGKKIRKKLWMVFWIMLIVTLIELVIGINQDAMNLTGTITLKFIYITFTIIKAGYIVYSFMHLGDENSLLRKVILWPYTFFALYLIALCTIIEGNFTRDYKVYKDQRLIEQKNLIREKAIKAAHGGGDHGGEKPDGHKEDAH